MVSHLLIRAADSKRLQRWALSSPLVQRISGRFIAGRSLSEGVEVARKLADDGYSVSLDFVGEKVSDHPSADSAREEYLRSIRSMAEVSMSGGISVKPTQLGVSMGMDGARRRLGSIAEAAKRHGLHVTLDMEDSTTTEQTIRLVEHLQSEGLQNVGCALQAYLHRTPDDLQRLNSVRASIRLCKGAYAEPPRLALQGRTEIREAYLRYATVLLKEGSYPRFATHDHALIGKIRESRADMGQNPASYEFQMLYGVRTDVQSRLIAIGESLCVYVPFGRAWYPYFMRRLAERPANLLFFSRALLHSPLGHPPGNQ